MVYLFQPIPEKNLKIRSALLILLFSVGIWIRFYFQFIEWSFIRDEINLGLDILNHSFENLFSPFKSRQSAPPLFLLLEKLFSYMGTPYISLKLLTFVASCASLFLFNRLLNRHFPFQIQVILLAVFCLNPFIIANSLTLKQYGLDLLFGLVAVNYFSGQGSYFVKFLFFSIFCLASNAGLFFCASFSIFIVIQMICKSFSFWKGIKKVAPFVLAPVPYLLFYFWFLQQPGAEEMRSYMVKYWSGAFVPMDGSVLFWIALQGHNFKNFFLSTYWAAGLPLLLFFVWSLFYLIKKRKTLFENPLLKIIGIYILAALTHLMLSALKMYPFSDRLFLYLAPGIYLILGFGILEVQKKLKQKIYRIGYYTVLLLLLSTTILYFTYLPGRKNDVVSLMEFINSANRTIALTPEAKQDSKNWLEFTNWDSMESEKLRNTHQAENISEIKSELLVAVQSEKFGHKNKLSTPEPIVQQLFEQNKISFFHRVGGFVIYKMK